MTGRDQGEGVEDDAVHRAIVLGEIVGSGEGFGAIFLGDFEDFRVVRGDDHMIEPCRFQGFEDGPGDERAAVEEFDILTWDSAAAASGWDQAEHNRQETILSDQLIFATARDSKCPRSHQKPSMG